MDTTVLKKKMSEKKKGAILCVINRESSKVVAGEE